MKTIRLYGHLGKQFGREHKFDVRTPAEAVSALCANFDTFKPYVIEHSAPGYKVIVGKEDRSDPEEVKYPADADTIKIIPVIGGSGNLGKIILGAVLIWAGGWLAANALSAAFATSATTGMGFAASATLVTTVSYAATAIGTSLVMGGIAGILFKPPKIKARDGEANQGSANFNGPLNLSTQGNPVPLAYGKVMVGSQIISAGIRTSKKIYPPQAQNLIGGSSQNIYNRTYVRAFVAGTDDKAGKVAKFRVTGLPTSGTLYLDAALTVPVVLNQDISTEIRYNGGGSSNIMEIFGAIQARMLGYPTISAGTYYRGLFYKPAAGATTGTSTFSFIAIDDDNALSNTATSTVKWVTINDNSDVQPWWEGN